MRKWTLVVVVMVVLCMMASAVTYGDEKYSYREYEDEDWVAIDSEHEDEDWVPLDYEDIDWDYRHHEDKKEKEAWIVIYEKDDLVIPDSVEELIVYDEEDSWIPITDDDEDEEGYSWIPIDEDEDWIPIEDEDDDDWVPIEDDDEDAEGYSWIPIDEDTEDYDWIPFS